MRKRFIFLAIIMVIIAGTVMAVVTIMLYRQDFDQYQESLKVTAQSQARLLEAVARYDARMAKVMQKVANIKSDARAATLSQIIDAHENCKGFGKTGEFTLACREGENIVFTLWHRHDSIKNAKPIPYDSNLAEPMRLALQGKSGTIIGLDYKGDTVLAAYEPIPALNMGIVAKINLSEIRAPFIRSSVIAGIVGLLVILAGTTLFFWIGNPIIRRLETYSANLEAEIEQRKQAEIEIKSAKSFLDTIVDMSPFAMWVSNPKGTVIRTNKSLCNFLNLNAKDIIGKYNVFDDHNLEEEGVMPAVRDVFEKKRPARFNLSWKAAEAGTVDLKYGRNRYIDVAMFPIVNAEGNLLNVVCQWLDITERKEIESALYEANLQYEETVRAGNVGLWDWELATNNIHYSTEWKTQIGYAEDEISDNYDEWESRIHPEDLQSTLQKIQKAITERIDNFHAEFRFRHKNGSWLWIAARGSVLKDETGKAVRVVGTHVDITASKKAEQRLRESVQRSKAQRNALVQLAVETNMLEDTINGALKKLAKITANTLQVARTSVWLLSPDKSELQNSILYEANEDKYSSGAVLKTAIFPRYFDAIMADSRVFAEDAQKDLRTNGLKDSYLIPLGITSLLDAGIFVNGELVGVVSFEHIGPKRTWFADEEAFVSTLASLVAQWLISAKRKEAEELRAKLSLQLEDKNRELEQVIFAASHDLRSPLVNIDGYSKELEKATQSIQHAFKSSQNPAEAFKAITPILNDDIPDALHYIKTSTSKMETLLQGLLRLSRLGRESLKFEVINMNELVSKMAEAVEFQIHEAGAKLFIENLPECLGDAIQVNQVFSNLLVNALQYLSPDSPGIIRITGKIEDNKCIYCVEDNGIGIAENHQNKIFDIFHRLDPGHSSGEGLGLTIVKQALSRISGQIWVESELGEGSSFYVALPKAEDKT